MVEVQQSDWSESRRTRYGIFRTKTPELKLVLPRIPQARTQVWLDDGDESTDDEIDVTSLVKPASGVTTWSNDREWVELGKDCIGKVNETVGRKRLFEECIETGPSTGNCCLFLHGENRLQVRADDVPIFCAHALHYTDANETVPPGQTQIEMIGEGEDALPFIKDCLALDFKDGSDDGAISTVLHALRLRPRAYAGFHKIVMGQSHASMTMAALQQLCDTIAGFAEPTLESLSLAPVSPVDAPNTGFLEHVPRAFHADFASPRRVPQNRRATTSSSRARLVTTSPSRSPPAPERTCHAT